MDALLRLRRDSLAEFLSRWHGPSVPSISVPVAVAGGSRIPSSLHDWYSATSGYPKMPRECFTVLAPEELEFVEGRLVFVRENQEVYEWACDLSGPASADPPVVERATDEGEPWYPSGVRLSEFLVTVAVFETIMAADHSVGGAEIAQATLDEVLGPLTALPVPGPTLGAQLYAAADVLALAMPDIPGDQTPDDTTTWWINVAGRTPADLEHAARVLGSSSS